MVPVQSILSSMLAISKAQSSQQHQNPSRHTPRHSMSPTQKLGHRYTYVNPVKNLIMRKFSKKTELVQVLERTIFFGQMSTNMTLPFILHVYANFQYLKSEMTF